MLTTMHLNSEGSQPMNHTLTQDAEVVELRERCAELEREVQALQAIHRKRLTIAADVHRSLIPKPVKHDRIWVDVRYIPVEDVGGDYCQVRFPDRNTCYITMCDVMGHGVGSALLATRISSEVRYGIMYRREPREILASLEQFMCEHFSETGLFLTFVAARIDLVRQEMTWSGAGHPSPLLIRRDRQRAECLASQNPIIGVDLPDSHHPRQETASLRTGDRLFVFTDGLFEVLNSEEKQLGLGGFARIAKTTTDLGLFDVADQILDVIHEYRSGGDTDDQTLVIAEIH